MSAKYLENISKMLRRWCWENVGKFFAKCCQNVRKSWQNIGKLLVKCWVTVTVRKKLAKYWRHHHISYMKKVFIVEPLSFMYPKISLISIHPDEAALSIQTFKLSFRHSILYICITFYNDIQFHFNLIAAHTTCLFM